MSSSIQNKLAVLLLAAVVAISCKSPEARRPVSQDSGSYIDESVQRNREIVAVEEARIEQMIEADTLHEYISSPYGFWYYYNKKDTTSVRTPEFGDVVTFEYSMQTLDGQPIYSQAELPRQTYAIDQQELFTGLREGLKLMKEGETVTFLFPSHKAYGFYGDKKRIGSDVPLMSTVTLYEITSANTDPEEELENQENNNQNQEP